MIDEKQDQEPQNLFKKDFGLFKKPKALEEILRQKEYDKSEEQPHPGFGGSRGADVYNYSF